MATKKEKSPKLTPGQFYDEVVSHNPRAVLSAPKDTRKKVLQMAFGGGFNEKGPFDASTEPALRSVLQTLVAYAKSQLLEKFKGETPDLLVECAKETALNLHSHHGKYLSSEATLSICVPTGTLRSPYLSSASVGAQRSITTGLPQAPLFMSAAIVYYGHLKINEKLMTVAELLVQRHPVVCEEFLAAGLTTGQLDEVISVFSEAMTPRAQQQDGKLPTLIWPTDEGDVRLQAVPSFAMYNAIAAMRKASSEEKLRSSTYLVMSGQPQNVSMAATAFSGNLPVLMCVPPLIVATRQRSLERSAYAGALLHDVPPDALKKFDKNIHLQSNAKRGKFLSAHAYQHVICVLQDVIELREAPASTKEFLADVPSSPVIQFARGDSLTPEIVDDLTAKVVAKGPSRVFETFSPGDIAGYLAAVRQHIQELS
jgi:hypothetical protein